MIGPLDDVVVIAWHSGTRIDRSRARYSEVLLDA
jgi:hypothetical protein